MGVTELKLETNDEKRRPTAQNFSQKCLVYNNFDFYQQQVVDSKNDRLLWHFFSFSVSAAFYLGSDRCDILSSLSFNFLLKSFKLFHYIEFWLTNLKDI